VERGNTGGWGGGEEGEGGLRSLVGGGKENRLGTMSGRRGKGVGSGRRRGEEKRLHYRRQEASPAVP